jgi:hypothetical protein
MDLDLIEPAGVDWGIYQHQVGKGGPKPLPAGLSDDAQSHCPRSRRPAGLAGKEPGPLPRSPDDRRGAIPVLSSQRPKSLVW